MPWTRKTTAPAFVNGGEAFAALITGDATWGWLLGWVPLIGNPQIDVTALCALGPPTVLPLSLTDFIPSHPRNAREQIQSDVQLLDRLRSIMYDRVFSAYCESVVAAGTYTTYFSGSVCADHGVPWDTGIQPIPAGAVHSRVTFSNISPAGLANWWQYRNMYFTDAAGNGRVDWDDGSHSATTTGWASGPRTLTGYTHFRIMLLSADDVGPHIECGNVLIEFDGGGTTTHTATPQPAPAGLPARTSTTAATLAGIAAEVDNLEFKLDHVVELIGYLTGVTALPPSFADAPVPVVADTPQDITGAAGVIVTVSGIPAGADEQFGAPPKYHRLGRVTLGTADGWLPSFDLEHNPLVIMPVPAGVTRVEVTVRPPITATVTVLRAGK